MTECSAIELIMFGTRGVVLILIAVAGIMCIYLGWRLYKDAVVSRTTGELQAAGVKLKLASLGPGIFLAALGVWLLAGVANRPVQQTETTPAKQPASFTARSTGWQFHQVTGAPANTATKPCTQCLIRQVSRVMSTGEPDVTTADIALTARAAAEALTNAKSAGIQDARERAQVITRLYRISELAEATTK